VDQKLTSISTFRVVFNVTPCCNRTQ
jgi:hypothetical protein